MKTTNKLIVLVLTIAFLTESAGVGMFTQHPAWCWALRPMAEAYFVGRNEDESQKNLRALNFLNSIARPVKVIFVVPMYNEQRRLLPPSPENPLGEDALRTKIRRLQELVKNNPFFKWRIIAVDDGTPEAGSARCAQELWRQIKGEYTGEGRSLDDSQFVVKVITPQRKKEINSKKGAAVLYGLKEALKDKEADYIGYTDVDNSVDIFQTPNLFEPLYTNRAEVAIGSRWHPDARSTKVPLEGIISSKLYNLAVRTLMPPLRDILDTQRGFKLFRRDVLEKILPFAEDNTFSFDTELLILARLAGYNIEEVSITWFDSVKAKTFNMGTEALGALKNLLIQRRHIFKNPFEERVTEVSLASLGKSYVAFASAA